jgi:hypothetical protein
MSRLNVWNTICNTKVELSADNFHFQKCLLKTLNFLT